MNSTTLPVHFVWGDADNVFTIDWGRRWHSLIRHSTFDVMEGAGHFLQDTHGEQIVSAFLSRVAGR